MTLLPGVTPSTPNSFSSTFFTSAVRYSMNGGMESTSEFELDGISFLNQSDIPGIIGHVGVALRGEHSGIPRPDE